MKQSKKGKMQLPKEWFLTARDFVLDHSKIVMPIVLIVCVLVTVLIAVNANHKEALQKAAAQAAAVAEQEAAKEEETPVYELEQNAYPEINNLIRSYYDAQASGDIETISTLNTYLNDIEKIRVQELSKYIESYPVIDVYTKPGPTENTYVAYICSEVKFKDVEKTVPGMQTYYIGLDDQGNYFINDGTYDQTIQTYIKEVTLQDNVVDLNNKVVVAYNDLIAEDEEISDFIAYLKEKINEDVGEILAEAEQPVEQTPTEPVAEEAVAGATIKTVKATDVVNIRVSDSEKADKVDKAQIGQEFTLLEEKENGWSKISYNGGEAYIKSEFLEVVSEVPAENTDTTDAGTTTDTATDSTTDTSKDSTKDNTKDSTKDSTADTTKDSTKDTTQDNSTEKTSGTVTVKESVRVRKEASTDAEVLATAYEGEKLDLITKQKDGWSKVKYKGQTAYVKSEFLE